MTDKTKKGKTWSATTKKEELEQRMLLTTSYKHIRYFHMLLCYPVSQSLLRYILLFLYNTQKIGMYPTKKICMYSMGI